VGTEAESQRDLAELSLVTTLTGAPGEVAGLRRALDELASSHGFAERAADAVLALDELVANAREHGSPPIEVSAWADGKLVVEVSDGGAGDARPPELPDRPPRDDARSGRGLWIVRQLTDHVAVDAVPERTTVRFELTSEPPIGA